MRRKIFLVNELVKNSLTIHPELRDDDYLLYIDICKKVNPLVLGMDFETVMTNRANMGIPSYETVGRARRKLQELHPELRASKKAQDARFEQFKEVLEYVSSE